MTDLQALYVVLTTLSMDVFLKLNYFYYFLLLDGAII